MDNSDLFICIDHVAYVCPDAEEAAKYWTEVLGWHELHREVNDEQGVFEIMVAPAAELTEHMTQMQLISPTREDATTAKWLRRTGRACTTSHGGWPTSTGVRHAARAQPDPAGEQPRIGTGGSKINFIHRSRARVC